MTKLIVGCGYLGRRVAWQWRAAGHEVVGVVCDPDEAAVLAQEGIRPLVADVTRPETLARLPWAETVLFAVGYRSGGGKSRHEVYAQGLRAVLAAIGPDTRRVILISSTSVYGDVTGSVDEHTPCRPTREAGHALLAAEAILGAHPLGCRGITLRLAGLYGPGRLPQIPAVLAGEALAVPPGSRVNLIHVDDAAAIVLAAEARAQPPRTYVVSDGHPASRRDYYALLASLLAMPPPQFADLPVEGGQLGHRIGRKCIDNARMMRELGIELAYPSFREGLAAATGGGA
jgi:nucleoside-diphosphate-sugar epimerase